MPIMNWEPSLSIGIQKMDDDHAEILKWMNQVFDLHECRAEPSEIIYAVEQLYHVTVVHFREEEEFFESIGFPGAELHKTIHKKLLDKLAKGVSIIKKHNGAIDQRFFHFLRYWLSAHIKGIDTKYAAFSRGGVSSAA